MSVLSGALGDGTARRPRDFYPTIDPRAVAALAPHIPPGTVYAEPCAGDGALIELLGTIGVICQWAMDIDPQGTCEGPLIMRGDLLHLSAESLAEMGSMATCFITNPMWDRPHLHRFIGHLAPILPTWFLFDANWMQTAQSAALGQKYCTDIVATGRLRWFPPPPVPVRIDGESDAEYKRRCKKGSSDPPTDCAWYRFSSDKSGETRFHWRAGKIAAGGAQAGLFDDEF